MTKGDYRKNFSIGIASVTGEAEKKQKFAELLEQALEVSEEFKLFINGHPFALEAKAIIGHLQRAGEVTVTDQQKRWGVKVTEPEREPRWYTDDRYNQFDAEALAKSYNGSARRFQSFALYKAEVIPEDEKY